MVSLPAVRILPLFLKGYSLSLAKLLLKAELCLEKKEKRKRTTGLNCNGKCSQCFWSAFSHTSLVDAFCFYFP